MKNKTAKVCFTGPRALPPNQAKLVEEYLTRYIDLIRQTYSECHFHVGDAKGLDKCVENLLLKLGLDPIVHEVGNRHQKSAYAIRSMRMVEACSDADKCMIFGFPNKEFPASITLQNPFCGSGSGAWATLTYAKSKGFYLNIHGLGRLSIPSWMSS